MGYRAGCISDASFLTSRSTTDTECGKHPSIDVGADYDPELMFSPRMGHRMYQVVRDGEEEDDFSLEPRVGEMTKCVFGEWSSTLSANCPLLTRHVSWFVCSCGVLAYAHGHIFNDMAAACWFSYLLIFLTDSMK